MHHLSLYFSSTLSIFYRTFREISKGEQLFIFYGNDFFREYPINRSENACGLPNQFNFSIFSPKAEISQKFVVEEYPAWISEIIEEKSESGNGGNLVDFWKAGKRAQEAKNNPLLLIDKCKDPTLVPFLKALDKILKQNTNLTYTVVYFLPF